MNKCLVSKKVMFPYLCNYFRRILQFNDLSLFLFLVLQVLLFGSLTAFDTLHWCALSQMCRSMCQNIFAELHFFFR